MEDREPSTSGWRYVSELDGLRAIAILAVLGYHCQELQGGYAGVSVFFVLSGYLITGLLLNEHTANGHVDYGAFYIRRALRLFPALIVVVVVFAVVFLAIQSPPRSYPNTTLGAVASLTYINDFVSALGHRSVFGITWSLGVEEQFYLLWPAIMLVMLRATDPRRAGRLLLVAGIGIAVIYAPLARISPTPNSGLMDWMYFSPLGNVAPLFVGSSLAFTRRKAPLWLTVFAGVVLLVTFLFAPNKTVPATWEGYQQLVLLCSCVLVAGATSLPLLRFGVLVWIGRRSYGIYLLHFPILCLLDAAVPSWANPHHQLLVVIPASLILAGVMFRYVEQPALKLKSCYARVGAVPQVATGT